MSVDISVYLGPYIVFKTKKIPQRIETYHKFFCNNPICSFYNKNLRKGDCFCVKCGSKIETKLETYQEDMCLFEYAENKGINEQVNPSCVKFNTEFQVWFPNIGLKRNSSWDVKYDRVFDDLTDLNVQNEIETVKNHCSKAIKILEEEYEVDAEICWGIIKTEH